MFRKLIALAVLFAALAIFAAPAWALIALPPPGPFRIVNSDAVFIGKVTKIEMDEVDAAASPAAKQTIKYKIAEVEIKEGLQGLKGAKTIRIGFIVPMKPQPGKLVIGGGLRYPQVTVGQEGLFMISKHHEGKFYAAPNYGYFVASQDKKFNEEVKTAKKIISVMGDTMAALQSKDAEEQFLAASILVGKYRTNRAGRAAQQVPIDAKESKLILNAIANGQWQQAKFNTIGPWQLFFQLGINEADGFNTVNLKTVDEQRKAVQAWVRDHGDTYRIKRFVAQAEK